MLTLKIFQVLAREPGASKLRSLSLTVMFRPQVIITALGAARIHRGLIDYPAFNDSAKAAGGTVEWPNGLNNSESTSPLSNRSCPTKREHDTKGVSVVVGAFPVAMSSTEVHRAERNV